MSELGKAVGELERAAERLAEQFEVGGDGSVLRYLEDRVAICRMWAATPTQPADVVMDRGEQWATRLEAGRLVAAQAPIRAAIAGLSIDDVHKRQFLDEFDDHCDRMIAVRDTKSRRMTWGDKTSLLTHTVHTFTVLVDALDLSVRQTHTPTKDRGADGL